jgi:hypothetical protein
LELGVARRSLRYWGSPAMSQLATRKGMLHRLGPQNGSISNPSVSEESHRIREWLLRILRFAVTLEQRDRAAVMSLAAEMDRLGATQSGFSYFTRTSTKLCDCITAKHDFDKLAELCFHIEKIDDRRLRRALEGALFAKRNKSIRSRQPDREYLWKGLAVK